MPRESRAFFLVSAISVGAVASFADEVSLVQADLRTAVDHVPFQDLLNSRRRLALEQAREVEYTRSNRSANRSTLSTRPHDALGLHHVKARVGIIMQQLSEWNFSFISSDIFPDYDDTRMPDDGDEGLLFFHSASPFEWSILLGTCCFLATADQCFPYFRDRHRMAILCWISIALVFNIWIGFHLGTDQAFSWLAGYILEWMLSMDNLFVFHLIFQTYQTPPAQRHKALFVGIVGAIGLRVFFFMAVSGMLGFFTWARFVFGGFLIWSGIETARSDDDDDADVKNNSVVVWLRRCLGTRLLDSYDEEGRIFVRGDDGRLKGTLLFVVIVCLEATDIVFAIDSVSAKCAQIPDQYIAFGSSALAMFGLRAMFFVVQELVDTFELMKYGLCLILVFIGLELMCCMSVDLPPSVMCILITAVISVCIVGSKAKKKAGQESLANTTAKM